MITPPPVVPEAVPTPAPSRDVVVVDGVEMRVGVDFAAATPGPPRRSTTRYAATPPEVQPILWVHDHDIMMSPPVFGIVPLTPDEERARMMPATSTLGPMRVKPVGFNLANYGPVYFRDQHTRDVSIPATAFFIRPRPQPTAPPKVGIIINFGIGHITVKVTLDAMARFITVMATKPCATERECTALDEMEYLYDMIEIDSYTLGCTRQLNFPIPTEGGHLRRVRVHAENALGRQTYQRTVRAI